MYYHAFKDKIIPNLITVLSKVLGMIPFMLHGKKDVFWFAFAMGTIGGLIFSLIILVLVLPAFIIVK
jgi:multidrug efflux pump subunit AcrB